MTEAPYPAVEPPSSTAVEPPVNAAVQPPVNAAVEPPAPLPGTEELFTLDRESVHLNHGSYGAVPVPVQRVQERLRIEQERDPDGFFADLPARVGAARTALAAELGTDPALLALVSNVTEAVAVALDSVPLAPGDRILVTDHGYGAVTEAVRRRAAEAGAEVDTVRLPLGLPDQDAVTEAVLAAVGGRTVLAVLDQIASPTARRIAGPALLAALREGGVTTVVDGAHAPGMLAGPVEPAADFWFGNLHKWAFAPRATGVLAVRPEWAARVRPLALSWEHHRGYPACVEWRGTCDYTPWLAAPAGFEVLRSFGADRVRQHNERLAGYGQALLAERLGLEPLPATPGVSMRALRLPRGWGEEEAAAPALMAEVWRRHAVRTVVRPWPGGGVLRVSAQLYNRPRDYERLAAGLAELLKER
ncbi:aminotransferase class V-fold PLP-dependent enzyme [Kitasatospora sp. CM 4170]|uniref:Aminotransferase class V-fold PLP-dependent enzyme n=1 Tax=Kitasatospora aburaviensis TaxID=67265 RepID=A0ABW1EZS0_9ACTN|nr:aminotransferase class V-fold PLP-dependent enzyme [Kitasatospora sp. CM 4170]WNM44992.1 aminotransferase class V-fold PLP-dependent enzyme [Kitasatospora sp. CM 4170]